MFLLGQLRDEWFLGFSAGTCLVFLLYGDTPFARLAAISQTGEVHRDPGSEKIVLQQWFVSGLKGNPDADGV